jgi:molybdate transport system ATP-binding protein
MIDINLKHHQGDFELNVDCAIDAPLTGLFGPSGAGKSTLLSMIAGLTQPTDGRLTLDGEILFDRKRGIHVPLHRRRIGMVFQESRLFPHLHVMDNLRYGYRLLKPAERRIGFDQIVALLELRPLLTQKPHQLSGGEKQRIALGRALLTSPRLLLMDEPLASLDTRLKQQILPFLRLVRNELNIPMIYVSHSIDEILYLTSHIAMMNHGQLLAIGPFSEVIHQTPVLSFAQSLGLENVLHGPIQAHLPDEGYTVITLNGQLMHIPLIKAEIGAVASVSIPASNVALSTQRLQGITIQNQLAGLVQKIQSFSHKTLITIQLNNTTVLITAEVTAKSVQDLRLSPGSQVYCLIKTQSIHPLATLN